MIIRTFLATASELKEIVGVLDVARALLAGRIEAEERRPTTRRVPAAELQHMKVRMALLARVTREIAA